MTKLDLPPLADEIRLPGSRFFHHKDACVPRRRNSANSQWFLAFLCATLVAAVLVPSYPNADRLFHPFVLARHIWDERSSPAAWEALGRRIIHWVPILIGAALLTTFVVGLISRPERRSQKPAPEQERV